MRSFVLGFVAGAGWLQMQEALPSFLLMALLCAAAVLSCWLALRAFVRFKQAALARIALRACAAALFGFVWAALFAHAYLADELPAAMEGQDVTVIGTIDSLPHVFERGERFNFNIETAMPINGHVPTIPRRIALSWYSLFDGSDVQDIGQVQPGERWRLTVRLRKPHGNANPHGFDYEVWLLEQGIRATGYVRPDADAASRNVRLDPFVFSLSNVVERGRALLRGRIEHALQGRPYAQVIVALVVGDQRGIPQSDWDVFNNTGISHLVSISGLHITMIAALVASIVFALWRRSFFTAANLPLRLPAQKAAALAGVATAVVYVMLAGAGVPAQRTLYMLTVVAVALWTGRLTSVSHVLCCALAVVMLFDPWAVIGPGFWLSFAAVALILYVSVGRAQSPHAGRGKWRAVLKTAVLTQYAITVGLVPLTILLFAQTSLVSPIANAIAIPLVGFFVTPMALLGSVLPAPLSDWTLLGAHWLVASLAQWLTWLDGFSWAVWTAPVPSWWMFVLAVVGTLWLLAPRGWPARYAGAVLWMPLVLNVPSHPGEGEMWVTAFDVGQGMAVLIETARHRVLYDSGPAYSPEADGGNRVIVPYLRARGIDALDTMLISHSDTDHAGGALSIMKRVDVRAVETSLPSDHAIVAEAGKRRRRCVSGQTWEWDDVRFEMLHPTSDSYDSAKWKPNARSCTLKVTAAGKSILLPGDIEAVQEDQLLRAVPEKLRADILLAPHHGSGTSSTVPFLAAVQPQWALFQVGYRNRYRHPKQEVYDRYGELGITRLRNDHSGAITMQFSDDIDVQEYRLTRARYWYGR